MNFILSVEDSHEGFVVQYIEKGNNENKHILYRSTSYSKAVLHYRKTQRYILNNKKYFNYQTVDNTNINKFISIVRNSNIPTAEYISTGEYR